MANIPPTADDSDDGLFNSPREREMFDGAEPVKPPQPAQPMEHVVPTVLERNTKTTIHLPHNVKNGIVERIEETVLRVPTREGIKEFRDSVTIKTYGGDGQIISPENYRRCPVSGVVYSGPGVRCPVCKLIVFPGAMRHTIYDPLQSVCLACKRKYNL